MASRAERAAPKPRRTTAAPLPPLAGLTNAGTYARLVRLTGIPCGVFNELALDAAADGTSVAGIVKATVGPKAWRAAGAARTTEERARVLLVALRARRGADEAEEDSAAHAA